MNNKQPLQAQDNALFALFLLRHFACDEPRQPTDIDDDDLAEEIARAACAALV